MGKLRMKESIDVAIVGAGVTGLALALALRKKNVSTVILDARKNIETVPRGLTLQPNGLAALDELEVLDRVSSGGEKIGVFEIRNPHGKILLEADYGLLEHPQNYLMTVNASDLDLALRYKAEQSGAEVVWGARFLNLVQNDGQVQGLSFETDRGRNEIAASVVVGADGSQSPVRAAMGSRVDTKRYSDSFITGLTGPIGNRSRHVQSLQGRARQYQDPGLMLGLMPAGQNSTYFFYSVGARSFDNIKKAGVEEMRKELIQIAPEATEAFDSIQAWTRIGYFTPNYSKVDRWVDNGVALLGDSAHTFHPHAGQGLNLSLQDALVLADVIGKGLEAHDTSARTLQEYETRQKMYAEVIGMHADYSARFALSRNWLVKRLNRRVLRKLSKDKEMLKETLEIVAGTFKKKPSIFKLARMGGILP
jgi:2-polyprenyl-6-methoxyphenol hydroxylase-like FAD-dependent oxidoreductase